MKESLVDRAAVERLLVLNGAIRAGLIDALARDEAGTAEEVAMIAGADPRATRVVIEALVAEGLVEKIDKEPAPRYRLSPVALAHLVEEGPDHERAGLLHLANRVRGWLELPEVIRTGDPRRREGAKRDVRTLVSAMGERDPAVLEETVERCLSYAGPVRTMIDIGGAVGHVARRFSQAGVRATLFDKENVLPIAREYLGPDEGEIETVAGDFTQALPEGPFDLAYLGNILHIYGPETNTRVIGLVYDILSPGGSIVIQDYVLGRSARAPMFAVNMLQATEEGGVWTEEEIRAWLESAGFGGIEVEDLDTFVSQLVFGRKPVED